MKSLNEIYPEKHNPQIVDGALRIIRKCGIVTALVRCNGVFGSGTGGNMSDALKAAYADAGGVIYGTK